MQEFLPKDKDSYSWLDFGIDFDKGIIHSPYINLLPEHRADATAFLMNQVMESAGREMNLTHIRAYCIVNEKLGEILPRLGYRTSGIDHRGNYLEKTL